MSLQDVTYGSPSFVDSNDMEKLPHIQALQRNLHQKRFARMIKTIDDAVVSIIKTGGQLTTSDLTWTKAGALFGHNSLHPKRHVDHLWASIAQVTGYTKEALKALGSLLRWRISLREENWLLFRRDTGNIDPDTGKEITISEYWIKKP